MTERESERREPSQPQEPPLEPVRRDNGRPIRENEPPRPRRPLPDDNTVRREPPRR
jgi:hypothetical protein